ncbi:MAG: hypothetical protein R6U51_06545 [Anaerolineales bacterium]
MKNIKEIFLLTAISLFVLYGCNTQKEIIDGFLSSPTHNDLDSIIAIPSVKDHWAQAQELAQKWHPDAYLIDVTVDVRLPEAPSSINEVGFDFKSRTDKSAVLAVNCHAACNSTILESSISLPQCKPFELNDGLIKSKEALSIGLEYVERSFIHGKNSMIRMRLERNYPRCEGNIITWSVSFSNIKSFEKTRVIINAFTKEIIEVQEY